MSIKRELIDKHQVAKRLGVSVKQVDYWIERKALPYVQVGGKGTKALFSSTLIDSLWQTANGAYAVGEPDFSEPLEGSEEDEFTDMTVVEDDLGPVHQSRRHEYDAFVAARDAGKSMAEAIMAAEEAVR